jgi:DNA repair exonuclease SbcCD nuclease subunit
MRLLVFGDLHLDSVFAWARPESARRRRQALRDALLAILELAAEKDVEAILCAGDLYEQERFTPDTAEFLRGAFTAAVRPIYIAPGNHDWYGPRSLYAQIDWPENVHLFTEDRLTPREIGEGLTLWGAAHLAPRNTAGFLDRGFAVEGDGVHLALFHGAERAGLPSEIRGKEPHAPFDAEQIAAAGLLHAFVGHYHAPRDEALFTYPGNPEPLVFGEEGERGAVLVEVAADGSLDRRRVGVSSSEIHDLRLDLTGCQSLQDVRRRLTGFLAGRAGSARLTLVGELAPEVDLAAVDLEGVDHRLDDLVVRIGEIVVGWDLDRIAEEPTIRGRFVQEVRAATDLDELERRPILTVGPPALEGRDDLEVAG